MLLSIKTIAFTLIFLGLGFFLWGENVKVAPEVLIIAPERLYSHWEDNAQVRVSEWLRNSRRDGEISSQILRVDFSNPEKTRISLEQLQAALAIPSLRVMVVFDAGVIRNLLAHQKTLNFHLPLVAIHPHMSPKQLRELYPNSTGILCASSSTGTIRLASRLLPDYPVIAAIMDFGGNTDMEKRFKKSLADYPKGRIIYLDAYKLTFPQLFEQLKQLPENAVIALVGCATSKLQELTRERELWLKLNENVRRPLFMVTDLAINDGLVGGMLEVAADYHEQLYRLIVRVLRKGSARYVPFETERPQILVDYEELSNFNGDTAAIPFGATVLRSPPYWWRNHITGGSIVLFLLLAMGVVLVVVQRKRRHDRMITTVFKALPVTVIIVNRNHDVLFSQIDPDARAALGLKTGVITKVNQLPEEVCNELLDNVDRTFSCKKQLEVNYFLYGQARRAIFSYLPKEIFGEESVMRVSSDVSELDKARQRQEAIAEHLRITLESIGDGVIVTDDLENITMANAVATSLIGCDKQEIIGKPIGQYLKLVAAKDETPQELPTSRAIQEKRIIDLTNHTDLISYDGTRRHIANSASPILNPDGKVTGAVLVFRDVTREYEIRDQLQETNLLMQNAALMGKLGYFRVDEDIQSIKTSVPDELWKRSADGKPIPTEQWVCEEDVPAFKEEWGRLRRGETTELNLRYRSRYSGSIRYFNMRVSRIVLETSERLNFFGIIQDVTELIENELKYLQSNLLFTSVLENLPCSVFVKDFHNNDRYLIGNRYYHDMLGLKYGEMSGKTDFDLYSREIAESYIKGDMLAMEQDKVVEFFETLPRPGSPAQVVHTLKVKLKQPSGNDLLLGICMDVSEEQRLKGELERSNKIMAELLNHMPAAVNVKDPQNEFRYVLWNRTSVEGSGVSEEEVIGKTDAELGLMPEDEIKLFREQDEQLLQTGKMLDYSGSFRFPNGQEMYYQSWKNLIRIDERESLILTISVDTTTRHQLEEERESLIRELQDYNTQEHIINNCLSILVTDAEFGPTLQQVLQKYTDSLGADYSCVYEYDDDYSVLNLAYGCKHSPEGLPLEEINIFSVTPDSFLLAALQRREVVRLFDVEQFAGMLPETIRRVKKLDFKSLIIAGIWTNGRLKGLVVSIFTRSSRQFNELDDRLIRAIANMIELAMARRQQHENLVRSEQQNRLILDNINIPVMLFDAEGKLVSINQATARWRGKTAEELLSGPCHRTFCQSETYPDFCPIQHVLQTREPYQYEFEMPGKSFLGFVTPVLSPGGKLLNIVESIIDTTAQNEAKRQIIRAREAAEAANRAKSTFLATMSHEIRTPLNAVIGFSELLMTEQMPPEIAEHIHSINIAGRALLTVINDVLEISKIEADKLTIDYDWIRLDQLLKEIYRIFRQSAQQKGVELVLEIPENLPEFYLSATRLRQIFLNIIGNAVKFTHQGRILLKVELEPREVDHVELKVIVSDTGIGISPEDQRLIFDPFEQAKHWIRGTRSTEGTGLGLSIAARLAEKMNGKISLESELGKGSTFTIAFFNVHFRGNVQPIAQARLQIIQLRGYVWIVDDVEMNCRVMSVMLRRLGVENETMSNPEEVLKRLKESGARRPDLILSDMWMPQMNGAELAVAIVELLGSEAPPIIAVTADMEVKDNFSLEHFANVLLKPVTIEKLQKALEGFLEKTPAGD